MREIWADPWLAAGEEIDFAIEYTRSLIEMALEVQDVEWAEKAASTYRVLVAVRDTGLLTPPDRSIMDRQVRR